MPTIEIRKAERKKSKLRLGIAGPSGAGKTMGSLKLAHGLGGRICLIDTERGSGDLYAHLFDYSVITLEPPYAPKKYVEAIKAAEDAGFNIIIIDSLSHAWSDEGGLLDQADKLSNTAGKNRFTVWSSLTPQHRQLVNAMLGSTSHIIATVRSKQDYSIETDDRGKTAVKKLGLAPVQREGMEYEFTVFIDVDINHYAKTSKDRTDMFRDEVFPLDESIGERLSKWLNEGKEDLSQHKAMVGREVKRLNIPHATKEELAGNIKKYTGLDLVEDNYQVIAAKLSAIKDEDQLQDEKEKQDVAMLESVFGKEDNQASI